MKKLCYAILVLFGMVGFATADTSITFWGYAYYQDINYSPDNVPLPNTQLCFNIYNSYSDAYVDTKFVTTNNSGYYSVTCTVPTNSVGYDVYAAPADCLNYRDPLFTITRYQSGGQSTALTFPSNLTVQLSDVIYDTGN